MIFELDLKDEKELDKQGKSNPDSEMNKQKNPKVRSISVLSTLSLIYQTPSPSVNSMRTGAGPMSLPPVTLTSSAE